MSDSRIKLSVVSYLNSKPFIHALSHELIRDEIDLALDNPSDCAAKLLDGRVDIGLVPVAIIPHLPSSRIVSDYCIAAEGQVGSVLLLSHAPLKKIKKIYLDYQSRSSVQLVRILAKKLWKIQPEFIEAMPGYEDLIREESAGVVIGDRALMAKSQFPYVYDLSEEWEKLTGLPFVFACWVANKIIRPDFLLKFNMALASLQENIPLVASLYHSSWISSDQAEKYLQENIHYKLDERKRAGMTLFIKYLQE